MSKRAQELLDALAEIIDSTIDAQDEEYWCAVELIERRLADAESRAVRHLVAIWQTAKDETRKATGLRAEDAP